MLIIQDSPTKTQNYIRNDIARFAVIFFRPRKLI